MRGCALLFRLLTAPLIIACSSPLAAADWWPVWTWLPSYTTNATRYGNPYLRHVPLSHVDRFVYHGRVVTPPWPYVEPSDSPVRVLHLSDGPMRGRIVYDRARGLAFYTAACCSSGVVVFARVSPPSESVTRSDLGSVHTERGIRLGDSIATVRALDGAAEVEPIDGYPGLEKLSYETGPPKGANPSCGQVQRFVFTRNVLVYIEFAEGC